MPRVDDGEVAARDAHLSEPIEQPHLVEFGEVAPCVGKYPLQRVGREVSEPTRAALVRGAFGEEERSREVGVVVDVTEHLRSRHPRLRPQQLQKPGSDLATASETASPAHVFRATSRRPAGVSTVRKKTSVDSSSLD